MATDVEVQEEVQVESEDLFDALLSGVDTTSRNTDDDHEIEKRLPKSDQSTEPEEKETPEKETEDVSAIVEKSEKGEALTDEEIEALKNAGYEFEEETPVETKEEENPEAKEEEKPKAFEYDDLISELYPDEEFATNEEKSEALREFVREEMVLGQKLAKAFEAAPGLSAVIKDLTNGIDPAVSLLKHLDFNPEREPDKDDPDYEKWVEAKIQRRIMQEQRDGEKEAIKQNFQSSGKQAQEFAEKHGLKDGQKSTFYNAVNDVIKNISKGKIETPIYELVLKGLAYDTDIKKAKSETEIRNAKKIVKIRREQLKGDGLPKLKGGKVVVPNRNSDPMLDNIERAVKSQNTNWGID